MGIPFASGDTVDAILFDVDGTICDSDPLHLQAFRELLEEVGYQADGPIDEEFFKKHITGKHNSDICVDLLPDWDQSRREKFIVDKESRFRSFAVQHLKPVEGLDTLCKWVKERGIRRAAVTNAPAENAKLMISLVGLTEFFELVVLGSDCDKPKPYPDPYLKALKLLQVSAERAFAFEDSPSGIKAAVAAGLTVIGVATRNPEDTLLEAGASFVIKDFSDSTLWRMLNGKP